VCSLSVPKCAPQRSFPHRMFAVFLLTTLRVFSKHVNYTIVSATGQIGDKLDTCMDISCGRSRHWIRQCVCMALLSRDSAVEVRLWEFPQVRCVNINENL